MRATAAFAQAPAATPAPDHANPEAWLSRPDQLGPCNVDLSATVLGRDGSTTVERPQPEPTAPIDVFYVYPAVSTEPKASSDLVADAMEYHAVGLQLARFGTRSRLLVPLYRQVASAGVGRALAAGESPDFLGIGYDDIHAAWSHDLGHEDGQRAVVLIGHSPLSQHPAPCPPASIACSKSEHPLDWLLPRTST